MVHGREGFIIGDLVKVRDPSREHPTESPGMPGTYRITNGPGADGTYQVLPAVAVHPQFVKIHGYWLMPADDAPTEPSKYHSVGQAIDLPGGRTPEGERYARAMMGLGPDEPWSTPLYNGSTDEED